MSKYIGDIFILAGLISVCLGCFLISLALGLIVSGIGLILYGSLLEYNAALKNPGCTDKEREK